jgi:hypothetical protein
MPRPRGAGALAVVGGMVHHIGGASNPEAERASVSWHEVYDPRADRWETRKALPGARDHAGVVVHNGLIHIVGGRFNTFEYNTPLHHVYDPARDQWETRAPLPPRAPATACRLSRPLLRHGGESGQFVNRELTGQVHGQMEATIPCRTRGSTTRRCRRRGTAWVPSRSATGSMSRAAARSSAAASRPPSTKPSPSPEAPRA